MKRIVCVLVSLILTLVCAVAFAVDYSSYSLDELLQMQKDIGKAIYNARMEKANSLSVPAPYKGEITFRDVGWGDNYSSIHTKYPNLSSGYSSTFPEPVYVWAGGSKKYKFENGNLTIDCNVYSDYSVAGYGASISFLFAYTVTDPIVRELDNTMLIGARYSISDLSDPDGVANDLIEKLTSVYGECSGTSTGTTLGGYSLYYYFWHGANDTFIVLKEMNGGKTNSNTVTISYGWNGSDEYINAFDAAISAQTAAEESTRFGNGNTDGL